MRTEFGLCAALLAGALQAAPLEADLRVLMKQHVIEWQRSPDNQPMASFPQVKLYAAGGRLLAAGSLAEATQAVQQGTVPAGVRVRRWADEQRLLGIRPAPAVQPVLVVYRSDPCPPCDELLAPTLAAVRSRFPAGFATVMVTATVR